MQSEACAAGVTTDGTSAGRLPPGTLADDRWPETCDWASVALGDAPGSETSSDACIGEIGARPLRSIT